MRYLKTLGDDTGTAEAITGNVDLHALLQDQAKVLEQIRKASEEQLLFRKIATIATVAGAAFAMLRLTDIWIALQERKERKSA